MKELLKLTNEVKQFIEKNKDDSSLLSYVKNWFILLIL